MKIYQILVSRPRYEEPYDWIVPELALKGTTPRLDDIKTAVHSFISESDVPHEADFEVEMFVRFDPDAAREVHGGAIRMCTLLGFHPGERNHSKAVDDDGVPLVAG